MKKLVAILFSILLTISVGTNVIAAETTDYREAFNFIKSTNDQIDDKIDAAVNDAAKLYNEYTKASKPLLEKIKSAKSPLEKKVYELAYGVLTAEYNRKIDNIYTDLDTKTREMTRIAIELSFTKGIIAECEWKLVTLGDRPVWIDPVRVVGYRK